MRETADLIWGMKTENKEHVIYYSDKPFQATLLAVADFMVASVYNFLYWLGKNIYVTFKKHVWIWIFFVLRTEFFKLRKTSKIGRKFRSPRPILLKNTGITNKGELFANKNISVILNVKFVSENSRRHTTSGLEFLYCNQGRERL